MKIKCASCGKSYNTDVDEICPECGAYNSFDREGCTHYESDPKANKRLDRSHCNHRKPPTFEPETYEPQEYVPQEMERVGPKPAGNRGHRPPQYRGGARGAYDGGQVPRKKGKKGLPILIAAIIIFSIAAPFAAEAITEKYAYMLSSASQEIEIISCGPQDVMEVGGEFLIDNWKAQRVYEPDGTSYIYVSARAAASKGVSNYYPVSPYMEAGYDFWAPADQVELEWALESLGCMPDEWGLYFVGNTPSTVGWIFPDVGEDVIYICITNTKKGPMEILQSTNTLYQVELFVTEEGNGNGSI